jgi:hypothetical protein
MAIDLDTGKKNTASFWLREVLFAFCVQHRKATFLYRGWNDMQHLWYRKNPIYHSGVYFYRSYNKAGISVTYSGVEVSALLKRG